MTQTHFFIFISASPSLQTVLGLTAVSPAARRSDVVTPQVNCSLPKVLFCSFRIRQEKLCRPTKRAGSCWVQVSIRTLTHTQAHSGQHAHRCSDTHRYAATTVCEWGKQLQQVFWLKHEKKNTAHSMLMCEGGRVSSFVLRVMYVSHTTHKSNSVVACVCNEFLNWAIHIKDKKKEEKKKHREPSWQWENDRAYWAAAWVL